METLYPLVIPTDCQAGVQVLEVCIQPLSKPGVHKVIEQPKKQSVTHSNLVLSVALRSAS